MNEGACLLTAEESRLTGYSLVNRGDENKLQRQTPSNIWQKKRNPLLY